MDRATGRTFIELTDVLVAEVDLHRAAVLCAELLDVHGAGVLALDEDKALTSVAASGETAALLIRLEVDHDQGPGVDALRGGDLVECADLGAGELRWPRFAPLAVAAGMGAAYGMPCRLRDTTVGALTLYRTAVGALPPERVEVGRGLANTVALGVAAHRGREQGLRVEQLQGALNSRVIIEQAKGMLAERAGLSVDEAFAVMRVHARNSGTKIRDVARQVLSGALTLPQRRDR
jgi:hypothetical protein